MELTIFSDKTLLDFYKDNDGIEDVLTPECSVVGYSIDFMPFNYKWIEYNKPYFQYLDSIKLYSTSSLKSFIDIIFIVEYIYSNGYTNDIEVIYLTKRSKNIKKDIFSKYLFQNSNYREIVNIKYCLCCKKEISNIDKLNVIPNIRQIKNLFSSIYIDDAIFRSIITQCYEDNDKDINETAKIMERIHIEYGFSFEVYKNYLRKIERENANK